MPPTPPFPSLLRSAPSKALDFFAFDAFKKLLGDTGGYAQTFAAAGLAGEGSEVGTERARQGASDNRAQKAGGVRRGRTHGLRADLCSSGAGR